jgi:hypothetical protein
MALAEGPPRHVLAGEPDGDTVGQDGGKGELLGCGPVDRQLIESDQGLAPVSHGPIQLRMQGKVIGGRQGGHL